MTELGRNELRRRQKWFVEQNQFACSKGAESFTDLAPGAVLEAVISQRDCAGFQENVSSPAHKSREQKELGQVTVLPTWLIVLIIITAIAAITAAGIVVWEAFWR